VTNAAPDKELGTFGRTRCFDSRIILLRRLFEMKTTRILVAALVIGGLAGAMPAVSAKKHKAQTSTLMKKGSAANPSSEGNVGPGTNNNNGAAPGGR
jgi:hypothetical protein